MGHLHVCGLGSLARSAIPRRRAAEGVPIRQVTSYCSGSKLIPQPPWAPIFDASSGSIPAPTASRRDLTRIGRDLIPRSEVWCRKGKLDAIFEAPR
jgi:hypothetical protein